MRPGACPNVLAAGGHGEGVATFRDDEHPAKVAELYREAATHEHRSQTLRTVAAALRQVARVRKGRWAAEEAARLEQQASLSRQYAGQLRARATPPPPGRRWEWVYVSRGGR
jgi:hypothetical protein